PGAGPGDRRAAHVPLLPDRPGAVHERRGVQEHADGRAVRRGGPDGRARPAHAALPGDPGARCPAAPILVAGRDAEHARVGRSLLGGQGVDGDLRGGGVLPARREVSGRDLWRRLGQAVPAVAGLLVLTFLLIQLAPGDPVVSLGGEHGDAGHYAFIRAKFGLDRPWPEQLLVYARNILGGELGTSFVHGQPVMRVIA